MPRVVNLSAIFRVTSPKATLSASALSAAKRVGSLGYVGTSSLLTRRREPRNPLGFLRSAMACEWSWPWSLPWSVLCGCGAAARSSSPFLVLFQRFTATVRFFCSYRKILSSNICFFLKYEVSRRKTVTLRALTQGNPLTNWGLRTHTSINHSISTKTRCCCYCAFASCHK